MWNKGYVEEGVFARGWVWKVNACIEKRKQTFFHIHGIWLCFTGKFVRDMILFSFKGFSLNHFSIYIHAIY